MNEMKDSAPGEDGVRLRYICDAYVEVRMKVIEIVRMMFEKRANEWDASAKSGIIVPLFKKGDRKCVNNYRGVCLLSMCSRVLARVIAKRVSLTYYLLIHLTSLVPALRGWTVDGSSPSTAVVC